MDRNLLLDKLNFIGVRDTALKWFKSYLSDRSQIVSICGVNSNAKPVNYGVIQGSTLRPILFLIYINNITKLNLNGKIGLFADDTLILIKGKSRLDVRTKALSDLSLIKNWLNTLILFSETATFSVRILS